jgi:predicted Rossmann fold flavoprotein
MEIAIIGGGAAGFFSAINGALNFPEHRITIYEKSNKVLSKVRVSGGGRCNVTHACFDIYQLAKNYPRGEKQLLSAFSRFNVIDTIAWFEERGVKLKTEQDGRMFPVTNHSETIINCLLNEAGKFRVNIVMNAEVKKLSKTAEEKFELVFSNSNTVVADKVLVAAGGHPKAENLNWLLETGHEIVTPVPSLFTFNIPADPIIDLMGVSISPVKLRISGTKYVVSGPLLITHWGMSGPAILKLSSIAARELAEKKYEFDLYISWVPDYNQEQLLRILPSLKAEMGSKQIYNHCPLDLPKRLWSFLLKKNKIPEAAKWADLSNEQIRNIARCLTSDLYKIKGKTTFKEEFVTCGGISLQDIDMKTMESKKCKGIYFAGEVLDIDAITGGFNFQSAWTTGYIAALNFGK